MWPTEWRGTVYNCVVSFWTLHGAAQGMTIALTGSTMPDLIPIVPLDVLREICTTLVMCIITSVLVKRKVLRATHTYLPQRGTVLVNMQVINNLGTAFDEK